MNPTELTACFVILAQEQRNLTGTKRRKTGIEEDTLDEEGQSMRLELIATATFGLEAVVRREIEALGYDIIRT